MSDLICKCVVVYIAPLCSDLYDDLRHALNCVAASLRIRKLLGREFKSRSLKAFFSISNVTRGILVTTMRDVNRTGT